MFPGVGKLELPLERDFLNDRHCTLHSEYSCLYGATGHLGVCMHAYASRLVPGHHVSNSVELFAYFVIVSSSSSEDEKVEVPSRPRQEGGKSCEVYWLRVVNAIVE